MATTDEKKKKYTVINATSAPGINLGNYYDQVDAQKQYVANHPDAVKPFTEEQFNARYGAQVGNIVESGRYTYDKADAEAAKAQGLNVTATKYDGQPAYRIDSREYPVQEGASGADESLLSDQQYAAVQYEKQQWNHYNDLYNQVKDTDPELAAQYLQDRDNAHLNAERIRAGAWLGGYSGGQDGSMYIVHGNLSGSSGRGDGSAGYGSSGSYGSGSYGSGLSVPGVRDLSANVEDYSAYLEQMYAARKAAALAQLNAAYEKNVNELDRAEVVIADQYQAARNLSAGQSEQLKRNFAQYAAANGLNNGTAGQAELARGVTLQNNWNTINTAEADAVADLQLARANAEVEYNNAIAQAEASGDYELAAALYQEKVRVQEALIELELQEQQYALKQYQLQYQAQRDQVADSQYAQELAFQQQKYADSLAQEQNETLAGYGEAYLALGIMPSAEMLAAMGLSETDARKYIAAIQAEKK